MGAAASVHVEDNFKIIKSEFELMKSEKISDNIILKHTLNYVVTHFKIIKDEYELKKAEGISEDDLLKHMLDFIKKNSIKKPKKNRVRKILEDNPITLKVTCEDKEKVLTFNKSLSMKELKQSAASEFAVPMNYSVFHKGIYLTNPTFQALADHDSIHLVRHEKRK